MEATALTALESIVGPDAVLPASEYAVDGLTPRAAVAPSTYEQVAEVMRYAHAEELAIIPRGGGYLTHIGNVPARYDIALSLARLEGIVEYEPADMTVTCRAGTTAAQLNHRLRESGQFVPFSADPDNRNSVGGLLAANESSLRLRHGGPRDFTIGMRVVTAEGKLTRAGGRVVKNVAGYDLCKLYIGSLGTLGVIVEATFKVAPLPAAERALVASFGSASEACALAGDLVRRGLALRSAEITSVQPARFDLTLDIAGPVAAVERTVREAREACLGLEDAAADAVRPPPASDVALLCRASVLPTRVPALIEAIQALDNPRIEASPTIGAVLAAWPDSGDPASVVERLPPIVSGLEGTLVIEACPPDLKRAIDVFGDAPPAFELMRRLKRELDPKGILSPGRFLGRL
ncbi:MAG: FAD-binding oxidoreductase [Dehalococcoidia bacterium]